MGSDFCTLLIRTSRHGWIIHQLNPATQFIFVHATRHLFPKVVFGFLKRCTQWASNLWKIARANWPKPSFSCFYMSWTGYGENVKKESSIRTQRWRHIRWASIRGSCKICHGMVVLSRWIGQGVGQRITIIMRSDLLKRYKKLNGGW